MYGKMGEKSSECSLSIKCCKNTPTGWDAWTRTKEMQESKSCALPTWRHPNRFIQRLYYTVFEQECQALFSKNVGNLICNKKFTKISVLAVILLPKINTREVWS